MKLQWAHRTRQSLKVRVLPVPLQRSASSRAQLQHSASRSGPQLYQLRGVSSWQQLQHVPQPLPRPPSH